MTGTSDEKGTGDCEHKRVQTTRVCTLRIEEQFPAIQAVCLDCGATATTMPNKENH